MFYLSLCYFFLRIFKYHTSKNELSTMIIFYLLIHINLEIILIFFSFILISWRLTSLQYCSGSCHTLTWISHGFTCALHPDLPSHIPLSPIPLGLPNTPALSTCLMHSSWAGDLFHPC